mmetsp:Transcript_29416/g.58335  ORF Transcript_29416/g.58335 Transcript_29416/m.58335 type:complete len:228 (-) Transcript_29416:1571-2254(-)
MPSTSSPRRGRREKKRKVPFGDDVPASVIAANEETAFSRNFSAAAAAAAAPAAVSDSVDVTPSRNRTRSSGPAPSSKRGRSTGTKRRASSVSKSSKKKTSSKKRTASVSERVVTTDSSGHSGSLSTSVAPSVSETNSTDAAAVQLLNLRQNRPNRLFTQEDKLLLRISLVKAGRNSVGEKNIKISQHFDVLDSEVINCAVICVFKKVSARAQKWLCVSFFKLLFSTY